MILFKRIYWNLFLAPDWYFVVLEDNVVRPVFWNGFFWETRMERIKDGRVRRVGGTVPCPHQIKAKTDLERMVAGMAAVSFALSQQGISLKDMKG